MTAGYARTTDGSTTLDSVLDALIELTDLLTDVVRQQTAGMELSAQGASSSQGMCAGLDAVKAAVDAVRAAVVASVPSSTKPQPVTITDAAPIDMLAELKKHTTLLTQIKDQLAKGLLVKTVLSL